MLCLCFVCFACVVLNHGYFYPFSVLICCHVRVFFFLVCVCVCVCLCVCVCVSCVRACMSEVGSVGGFGGQR